VCACWRSSPGHEWYGGSVYRGVLQLSHVRLQCASELGCLALGSGADAAKEMAEFWEHLGGTGRIGLVLAATPQIAEAARQTNQSRRCVFLGNSQVEELLEHPRSIEVFKHHLRAQIQTR